MVGIVEDIKKKIVPILKKENIDRAGIIGSYARGEEKRGSDVDILVRVPGDVSLLGFVRIENLLEKVLKKNVDLVEYNTLMPKIRKQILNEEVRII